MKLRADLQQPDHLRASLASPEGDDVATDGVVQQGSLLLVDL